MREALEEYFGRDAAPILVRIGHLVGLIEHIYGLREAGDWRDAVAESLRALAPGSQPPRYGLRGAAPRSSCT